MFDRTRVKICHLLLKRGQYMLASVLPLGDSNFACSALLSVENDILTQAMDETLVTHPEIREWFLDRAANYLKRREIATRNFIEKINE